jgi:hypothetical protein
VDQELAAVELDLPFVEGRPPAYPEQACHDCVEVKVVQGADDFPAANLEFHFVGPVGPVVVLGFDSDGLRELGKALVRAAVELDLNVARWNEYGGGSDEAEAPEG